MLEELVPELQKIEVQMPDVVSATVMLEEAVIQTPRSKDANARWPTKMAEMTLSFMMCFFSFFFHVSVLFLSLSAFTPKPGARGA